RLQDDSDLRLCNLYTREIIDIPAPVERDGAFASYPAWSPDGQQITWSASYETGEHVLITYDLASNESRVLVDDLLPSYPRPQVLWGESGIVVVIENRSDEEGRVAPLYSPTGELLADDLSNHIYFALYAWVTDDTGKEYLARYTNSAFGDLVDPETGIIYFAQGIEMYSPLAPDGLIVTVTTNSEQTQALVELPDGETFTVSDLDNDALSDFVPFFYFEPRNISIAPTGDAFAIFSLTQFIWRDGTMTDVPENIPAADGTGVIWGPSAYRIQGELLSPAG
ncbi:MAG: hypothetical protein H7175_13865, partial [Burkholderiales bacterium]|nr:hypothetical protein [Anaerolineae bacterium]